MQRADFESNREVATSQSNFAARLVLASGGWIEFIQIILIFLRVACEKNLDGRTSTSSPLLHNAARKSDPAPQFKTAPIGFNVNADGNVRGADNQNTVTQLSESVTQTIMHPDEVLRWFETELRREPSNLGSKHAREETVIKRIHSKLQRAEQYIASVESIPKQPGDRFKSYLETEMFPVIDEKAPYPGKESLINLITLKTNGV
jgi:hypothetical protein